MANWSDLKAAVASIVKTNGNKEITGQLLQNVLNNIISNVGANSSFAGIATPETNPGTPDGNVFYIATTAGTYSNFNGIVINSGEAVIIEWRGSWVKKVSGFVTQEKLTELDSDVSVLVSNIKNKQDSLVSGKNIKTINGQPILGEGDISVDGGVPTTIEEGFFIADKNGNVGLKYDRRGLQVVKARPLPSSMIDTDPRILIIGNSYSVDAAVYLPKLLEGNKISYTIGIIYYSGKGLSAHIQAIDNNAELEYFEYDSSVGYWVRVGYMTTSDILNRVDWNAVFFHEVSHLSTIWEDIKVNLMALIKKVDEIVSYTLDYGYILTPAYGEQSAGYSEGMWEGINAVGKQLLSWQQLTFIIPIHTAIENARTNAILQSYGADLMASASDRHIEDGVGRYIEACAFYACIQPYFGNYKDIRESDFLPVYGENVLDGAGSQVQFPQTSSFSDITDEAQILSIKSALMAVAKPFEISKIK